MSQQDKRVFKCLSCGYLFGNMSDLKRHLKSRHMVQMAAIAGMDQMHISEVEVGGLIILKTNINKRNSGLQWKPPPVLLNSRQYRNAFFVSQYYDIDWLLS